MIDDLLVLVDDLIVALDCYMILVKKGGDQWEIEECRIQVQALVKLIKSHGIGHRSRL